MRERRTLRSGVEYEEDEGLKSCSSTQPQGTKDIAGRLLLLLLISGDWERESSSIVTLLWPFNALHNLRLWPGLRLRVCRVYAGWTGQK